MAGEVEVSGASESHRGHTFVNRVGAGWLSVYRTSMVSGRDFTDADRGSSRRVAIVNQAFVRTFLAGTNPFSQVIRQVGPTGATSPPWDIIGVTADAVYTSVRAPVPPTIYLAFNQIPEELVPVLAPASAALSVRVAAGLPTTLTPSVVRAIASVNPNVDVTVHPLADLVHGSMTVERTMAILSGFFGVQSVLLAVAGLYGITAYAVTRRRTEVGIRVALGAQRQDVMQMILREGAYVGLAGVAVGVVASLGMTRFLAGILFGVRPDDPLTFASVAILMLAITLAACYVPARRATNVDPMIALRCE
jgi:ABC-type antimicrobial peptide transport system permease subunit